MDTSSPASHVRAVHHGDILSPAMERWLLTDPLPDIPVGPIFSREPRRQPPPLIYEQQTAPIEPLRTIPPGFEQRTAAEGWPKSRHSIFSSTSVGLSRIELGEVLVVLRSRRQQLPESIQRSILAPSERSPASQEQFPHRDDLPITMDSTAPGAPPFVTAENSHHEGSTSHEESYDLQGRLRGMILANGTSSSQAVSISQGVYRSDQHHHALHHSHRQLIQEIAKTHP